MSRKVGKRAKGRREKDKREKGEGRKVGEGEMVERGKEDSVIKGWKKDELEKVGEGGQKVNGCRNVPLGGRPCLLFLFTQKG